MADLEDIGHIPGADPDDDSPYAGYTARDEENEFERIRNRGKAKGKAPELPKGPSASYKTLSYELSVASAKNRLSLSGNAEAALTTVGGYLDTVDEYSTKPAREFLWSAFRDCMTASKCSGELAMLEAVWGTFFGFNAPDIETAPGPTFAEYAYKELPKDLRKQLEQKGNEDAKADMMRHLELSGLEMYNELNDHGLSKQEKLRLIAQAGASFGRSIDANKSNVHHSADGRPVIEYTDSEGKKLNLARWGECQTAINDALGKNMTNKGTKWPFQVVRDEPTMIPKSKDGPGPETPGTDGPGDGPGPRDPGGDTTPGPRSDVIPPTTDDTTPPPTDLVPPVPVPPVPSDRTPTDESRTSEIAALFNEAGITPEQFNALIAGLGKTVEREEMTITNPADGSSSTSTVLMLVEGDTRTELTKDQLKDLLEQLAADPASLEKIEAYRKANDVTANYEGLVAACEMDTTAQAAVLNASGKPPVIAFDDDGMVVAQFDTSKPPVKYELADVIAFLATHDPERLAGFSEQLEVVAASLGIDTEGKRANEIIVNVVNEKMREANKDVEQERVVNMLVDEAIKYGVPVTDRATLVEQLKDPVALDENRTTIVAGKAVEYGLLSDKTLDAETVKERLEKPQNREMLGTLQDEIVKREERVTLLLEKIEEYGLAERDRDTLLTDKDTRKAVEAEVIAESRAERAASRAAERDAGDDLDRLIESLRDTARDTAVGTIEPSSKLKSAPTPERKASPTLKI